jgi:hypothetical protein
VAPLVVRQMAPSKYQLRRSQSSEGFILQDPVGRSILRGQFTGDHTSEEVNQGEHMAPDIVQNQRDYVTHPTPKYLFKGWGIIFFLFSIISNILYHFSTVFYSSRAFQLR